MQNTHPQRGEVRESPDEAEARAFRDSADRAEIRNEPALARYYRNQAWLIENGHEWLDDIKLHEVNYGKE